MKTMNAGRLEKIGRKMSFVLRHKPEAIGLTLDEHGWADVQKLIAGIAEDYPEFDMEVLREAVRTDSKQRYSFNIDETRIRANQGHSVQVDVEPKPAVPPEALYHGTATRFVDSIMREGLKPMSRLYVHLSAAYDTAVAVGTRHGTPVVLTVDARAMEEDGFEFFISENGVWLTKAVPVKYINNPRG